MQIEIIEHGSRQYDQAVRLRDRILRQPLGLRFTGEQLSAESSCLHVAGFVDDQIVACCVIADRDQDWFKIRQVAVDLKFQRMGLGRQLMTFVHDHIASTGVSDQVKIYCHARKVAQPFYVQLGYRSVGRYFEEVSIQHIRMEKVLLGAGSKN
jgi:predicted GNAT family N-acyltransferase